MLNRLLRATVTTLLTPLARVFNALGISPDIVTIVGTIGVCAGALVFYPRGQFLVGTLVVVFFAFSDTIDGIMARSSGRSSTWGYAGKGADSTMAGLALACLILGGVVSYAKARAEGLGMTANVGIAERADRLVAVLTATGVVGMGVSPLLLEVVLALLAIASGFTVVQRMLEVRRQAVTRA